MPSLDEVSHRAGRLTAGGLTCLGYEQITDLSSASTLTVPAGATVALLNPETKSVRWRDDGTAPTASVGMVLHAGDTFIYTGDLSAIQLIETAASAELNISYYE